MRLRQVALEEQILATICIALTITAGSCMGCAGAQTHVERGMTMGARALQGIDSELAPLYLAHHRDCLDASETRPAYESCMGDWNTVGDAMEIAREALLAAELSYRAATGEPDGEERWQATVACVGRALGHLITALGVVGVDAPDSLVELISFAGEFLGTCPEA